MAPNPIPPGYENITPYLVVHDGAAAIEFYSKALGAVEIMRFTDPGGRIGHAELRIRDAIIMLADEHPELNVLGPKSRGGSPVGLHLYVEDVDRAAAAMTAAGAVADRPVADQFYGDRSGSFTDPFGHVWHIATRVEELTPEEIKRRAAAMFEEG